MEILVCLITRIRNHGNGRANPINIATSQNKQQGEQGTQLIIGITYEQLRRPRGLTNKYILKAHLAARTDYRH
jgi:hypothetical protein